MSNTSTQRPLHFVGLGNAVVDHLFDVTPAFLQVNSLQPGDFKKVPLNLHALGKPTVQPGGSIANICYGLGLLGRTRGRFLGVTGDDTPGASARQSLEQVGLTTLAPQPEVTTFVINVLVTPHDGQRTFVPHTKVPFINPALITEAELRQAEWLLLEGYVLFEQPELFVQVTRLAKQCGTKVVLFLAAPRVAELYAHTLGELIRDGVDLLVANETEMHALMQGLRNHKEARAVSGAIHFTPRIITHGAGGATYMDDAHYLYAPVTGKPKVVDTTGAGDAFAAGFLDGHLRGLPLEDCLQQGHALASEVVQQKGARLSQRPQWAK